MDQNVLLLNDRQLVLEWSPGFERTMDWLEDATDLDRNLECLPSTEQLHDPAAVRPWPDVSRALRARRLREDRAGQGTHASDLADDPWFKRVLRGYFPRQLSERFDAELDAHPLRRQIVCTVVANDMINLGGITFAFRAIEETTVSAAAVARGFVVMRKIWDFRLNHRSPRTAAGKHPQRARVCRGTRHAPHAGPLDTVVANHDFRDKPIADAMARLGPPMSLLRPKLGSFLHGVNLQHAGDPSGPHRRRRPAP